MANTQKQQKRINQNLFARFTHPSPSLMKKWEKRRQKEGNGQEVLNKEIYEWMNEGKELPELKANYRRRIADRLWSKPAFQEDVNLAHKAYDESNSLSLAQSLREKYSLNFGWSSWLVHCVETGENDPSELILYLIWEQGNQVKHLSLDIYFPLPELVYEEVSVYLRMKELETFGDYYYQEEGGGRLKHSRPQDTLAKYNKIVHLRNSAIWRMRTDKEFLDSHTEYNRSELARAKKWERDGKPR